MPIRIYALAKDLKIDSKELVEFCEKAGIRGVGSALASVEDEDILKLKAWLEKSAFGVPLDAIPASLNEGEKKPLPTRFAVMPEVKPVLRLPTEALKARTAVAAPSVAKLSPPVRKTATSPLPEGPRPSNATSKPNRVHASDSQAAQSDGDIRGYSNAPLSLSTALAIDALHAQVAELGAILERLLFQILSSDDDYLAEAKLAELIDEAAHDCFLSVSADNVHRARIARNEIMHRRADHKFPSQDVMRAARNALVLAILDLLEFCSEELKAKVLSEFTQHYPKSKLKRRTATVAQQSTGATMRKAK
jgi:hypothetical protein